MLVQPDFLKKIKEFGLNIYEAKLWTALLSRGVSTAGELSDIANVPRSRSYDVLQSLEKKGFIVMKIGKPIKYIAVPPNEVLERVKRRIKQDADGREKAMDELRTSTILNELSLLHSTGIQSVDPHDITCAIKGRDNVYDHLEYLIKEAKDSVLFISSEEGMLRKYDSLRKSLRKAHERGVKIKFIAPLTIKSQKVLPEIQKIADVKNKNMNGRMCIVDNTHVTFFVTNEDGVHPSYDVGVWVNTKQFSTMLNTFVNTQLKN